jgi:EAL domain-containing protein (putative c-di-GMP-specific phosphodiesterase class I)
LCKIARRLEKINYEVSFSLARVGGDVFAVWLPEIKNQTVLEDIISAIKLQLSHRFKTFTNEMINLSGSIGVFSGDVAEFRSKDPLRKAEIAMLKAKKSNKDSVCYFNPLWLFENQEEVLLEHDFIAALGSGQIIAFYQPIVQQDYQTAGFALEALVRWSHPTKGIITPNIILPIAKRLGLMEELGRTIFEQACSDTRLFISKGLNLKKVSINISSEQLFSPQLVEQIKHCLDTHQVSASLIEFEIVEELISGDFDILSKQMEKLTDLGINLSIDDFGTGYSSLSRLKHLNVSKLKIDKSFIDALPNDENDICIVKAIIGLAKGMNLLLVAEGVEEEEQATWLFENGCDCLQGYLISKPIKPKDIIELMAEPVDLFKKK